MRSLPQVSVADGFWTADPEGYFEACVDEDLYFLDGGLWCSHASTPCGVRAADHVTCKQHKALHCGVLWCVRKACL